MGGGCRRLIGLRGGKGFYLIMNYGLIMYHSSFKGEKKSTYQFTRYHPSPLVDPGRLL